MTSMSPGARVRAAVQGEPVDRVPLCFWHHFRPEGSGERLAGFTIDFFRTKFDLDIVKIMPDLLPLYPRPEGGQAHAADWANLQPVGLDSRCFSEQLTCIRTLRARLGDELPIILTLFSPLGMAFHLAPKETAIAHLREDPAAFEQGLKTLAANFRELVGAAIAAGASGIFFSCMGATNLDLTPREYLRFAQPYDLQVLAGAQDGWLNIVHVHADPSQSGDRIYFEQFVDYPVAVLSWSDKLTGPSLREALTLTGKGLMAGMAERGPLTHGGEQELRAEMQAAVAQTKGRRLILANGCSVPDDTPEEWLHTARRLVDKL